VKELKSDNICKSYAEMKNGPVFYSQCTQGEVIRRKVVIITRLQVIPDLETDLCLTGQIHTGVANTSGTQ